MYEIISGSVGASDKMLKTPFLNTAMPAKPNRISLFIYRRRDPLQPIAFAAQNHALMKRLVKCTSECHMRTHKRIHRLCQAPFTLTEAVAFRLLLAPTSSKLSGCAAVSLIARHALERARIVYLQTESECVCRAVLISYTQIIDT